jgi:hypothetical protein
MALRSNIVRLKASSNYLLDRVIDLCSKVLDGAYRVSWPAAQGVLRRSARFVGDTVWLVRDLPRMSAYKLIGKDWAVVFVGSEQGLSELRDLIFAEEQSSRQEMGRFELWKLPAQTERWLAEGADLVVCELSRIYPWRFRARFTLTVPTWVHQILPIPEPPERLLGGGRVRSMRKIIHKAEKSGFSYRFSQSKADFDYFYYRMYLPYVNGRHGQSALVTRYDKQWKERFNRGGLILVTCNDTPVAGALCYVADDTCYVIEGGILDNDPRLLQQGVNVLFTWYPLLWGHSQGAKVLDIGGSRAWCSNGSFIHKRRWGAQVAAPNEVYSNWTLLAQDLPVSLQDRLNQIEFVSERKGNFYSVLLKGDTIAVQEGPAVCAQLAKARKHGLAGLAVVSPYSTAIYAPSCRPG